MSFIKWVGGKTKLADQIIKIFPQNLKNYIYIEPFLGSGSVLIKFLEKNPCIQNCICSDINKELIFTFNVIKYAHQKLIEKMNLIISEYDKSANKENFYKEKRKIYNEINKTIDNQIEIASLFIFLNKTCFRGLYRINNKGEFNTSYGNYSNPNFIDSKYIEHLSSLFNKYDVKFNCCSFEETLSNLNNDYNYIIYLDPPYLSTFNSYSIEKFNSNQLVELIEKINKENIKIILSNSNNFYEKYKNLLPNVIKISIQDKINSKKPNKKRDEVIMYN